MHGRCQAVLLVASAGKGPVQRLDSRDVHLLRAVLLVQHDAHGGSAQRRRVNRVYLINITTYGRRRRCCDRDETLRIEKIEKKNITKLFD